MANTKYNEKDEELFQLLTSLGWEERQARHRIGWLRRFEIQNDRDYDLEINRYRKMAGVCAAS